MSSSPAFMPGAELSEGFYREVVAPLIAEGFPGLAHSAGLIGSGSEVLGFDTPQSTDHHWGPRVMVFLRPEDLGVRTDLERFLSLRLPPLYRGWSTHWGPPDNIGVRLLRPCVAGQPIAHRVEVDSLQSYLKGYLGLDPFVELTDADWLIPSEQKLRTLRYGRVFRDDLGLQRIRERLSWYPESVWREKMAVLWQSLSDEEPFLGRCGDVGDELGSRLVASRLVELALHLAFLQEREFSPYSKWFGTAFRRLRSAQVLLPLAEAVMNASGWKQRQEAFNSLAEALARGHNGLGLTPGVEERARPFWGRPYLVIHGDEIAKALRSPV